MKFYLTITFIYCSLLEDRIEDKYLIIYGTNFDSDFGKYVNDITSVINIDFHPNYNHTYSGCNKYDIALLKVCKCFPKCFIPGYQI